MHFVQARDATEAQQLKSRLGAAAAWVGGGTALQLGWAEPAPALTLIDVSQLPEAQGIQRIPAGLDTEAGPPAHWRIGAATRLETLRCHRGLAAELPLLVQASSSLAAMSVRHLATLGGNVGWRFGDTLPALLVLGARVELDRGPALPLAALLTWPELPLVVALQVPAPDPAPYPTRPWQLFEKLGQRAAFSPTRLALAAHLPQHNGSLRQPRLAASGAGLVARRLQHVEQCLNGLPLDRLAAPLALTPALQAACACDLPDHPAQARLACRLLAGHLPQAFGGQAARTGQGQAPAEETTR